MENKLEQQFLTKGAAVKDVKAKTAGDVTISAKEAAEYCEYKRQRKRADIKNALAKSVGVLTDVAEIKKICTQAVKYRQSAVQMSPCALEYGQSWLKVSGVGADCFIGGNGETLSKVKAYEAKCALRLKAKELTAVLSSSMLAECRYGGIRRELKKLRRLAKKTVLKVRLQQRFSVERVARLSKICSDLRIDYLSVPHFDGCERLISGLSGGCRLEVFGVETLADYRRLTAAGVTKIVTENAETIYSEWMKEADGISFPCVTAVEKRTEEPKDQRENLQTKQTEDNNEKAEGETVGEGIKPPVKNPQTDYECRLEGKELKFS